MDEKKSEDVNSVDKFTSIPPPVLQVRIVGSSQRKRRVSWGIVGLITCVLYLWTQHRCSLHTNVNGNHDLLQAYMEHVRKGHKAPLWGKKAEKVYLSVPNPESALNTSRLFSSKPHMAGSSGDFDTAKDFLAILQDELGINPPSSELPVFSAGTSESRSGTLNISSYTEPQAWIDVYYPILNSPLDHSLEILGPDGSPIWTADLEEVSDEADPLAAKYARATPAWHGISKGGEAQGELINVQYGRKRDYDALVEAGVNFTGKIVLARSGGNFRGLKVKRAQELGAVAVLVYSDPRGDGTVTPQNGYTPYPHGPARNPTSVERGSVQFLSLYPGDPTTPGYPSYENSERIDGPSKPTIPSLPISWKNAEVLLKLMANNTEGLTVRLVNNVDEKITPIWNVMGVIPGHIKDEVVVLGGHRDAWVLGASDPVSGTTCVVEAVRGFGQLLKKGWKPLRTIVITSWDGEEFGLIGSTEWGEDFSEWIRDHVVAYLNMDIAVAGSRLRTSASPLLAHLLRQTAMQIPHPTSEGRTLWDARTDTGTLFGDSIDSEVLAMAQEAEASTDDIGINPLGSGSDYTVFLQHIGVPSSQAVFTSTLHDPVYHYHSIFDSQTWQELYGDPAFSRHVAIIKHIGLQVLHLSGDIVLPLNTTYYSLQLEAYLDKVVTSSQAASFDVDFSALRGSILALQAASANLDTEKSEAERNLKKILKHLKKRYAQRYKILHKMYRTVCKLKKFAGKECRSEDTKSLLGAEFGFPKKKLLKAIERVQTVNKKLISFERGFISPEGIEGREWYKHLGVAPGRWLGYGATTLPGLTEAITIDKDPVAASREVDRLKVVVDKLAEMI
ncbi:hypothetical protein V8B97DRAFT_1923813 [Scleroderma yunnanense]